MQSIASVGSRLVIALSLGLLPIVITPANPTGVEVLTLAGRNARVRDNELQSTVHEPVGAWEQVPVPIQFPLLSADFLSPDDGWAIGAEKIIHWDGKIWGTYDSPVDWTPYGVKMLASNDVWAVGYQEALLHWNGKSWQKILVPAPSGAWLVGLTFLSPKLGWAVGGGGDTLNGIAPYSLILQWDGVKWIKVSSPAQYPLHAATLLSETDGWAVGEMNEILRWDGREWHSYVLPKHDDYFYNAIVMTSSDDGWIVGKRVLDADSIAPRGIILHWDGKEWTEFQQTELELYSISMVTSSFGWAVGGNNHTNRGGSVLLHWDGKTWKEYPSPTKLPLNFVWTKDTNDGWLFAGGVEPPTSGEGSAVFRYVVKPEATLSPTETASIIPTETPAATATATLTPITSTPFLLTVPPTSTPSRSGNSLSKNTGALLLAIALVIVGSTAVFILRQRRKG